MPRPKTLPTETVPVASLVPAPWNPRGISEKAMRDLVRSIKEFGFVEPVVVNRGNMRVVGGHQRVEAAKRLGLAEVPATFVDLDERKEKALNVALNRITGYFDDHLLAALLEELDEDAKALAGYDETDCEALLRRLGTDPTGQASVGEVSEEELSGKAPVECPRCKFRFAP